LSQNSEITVAGNTDRVVITLLSPVKTVLHEENTPAKTPQTSRLSLKSNIKPKNVLTFLPEETFSSRFMDAGTR